MLISGGALGRAAALCALGLPGSFSAAAQEQVNEELARNEARREILVTGSRIGREDESGVIAPLFALSAERIGQRGQLNIADALNELPVFGLSDASPQGPQNVANAGANFVNLFGLGSQRTLTLVNGRRFVSGNPGSLIANGAPGAQVDLNSLPAIMVERIEVLATGSAPVYGADAIAGTVNIRLRQDVEGLESVADYGISGRGDARQWRLGALGGFGFAGGRGHLSLGGEHVRAEGLIERDRPFLASANTFQANPANTGPADGIADRVLIADTRANFLTYDGLPSLLFGNPFLGLPVSSTPGTVLRFNNAGALVAYNPGTRYGLTFSSGGEGVDLSGLTAMRAPLRRTALAGQARFEIAPELTAYLGGNYARTTGVNPVSQAVSNSAFGSGSSAALVFRADNPFLDPAAAATIRAHCARTSLAFRLTNRPDPFGSGCTFFLSRSGRALTDGATSARTETHRILAGLRGDITLATRPFHYDISFNRGRYESFARTEGISQQRFTLALDAVGLDSARIAALDTSSRYNVMRGGRVLMGQAASALVPGDIGCAAALAVPAGADARLRADAAACVPMNYFGEGNLSAEARSYVLADYTNRGASAQDIFAATITGAPFALPGGDAGFSAGYEFRDESTGFAPDEASALGLGRATAVVPVAGGYRLHELYAELRLPLVRPGPVLSSAELEGAARWISNSRAGEDLSWSGGARIGLLSDRLTLRGQITQSVRAPAVAELFTPTVSTFSPANDPCDRALIDGGPNPGNRRANCEAAAAALGFADLAGYTAQSRSLPLTGITGGNPDLENERARSFTLGITVQPDLDGETTMRLSVDYVRIALRDAITNLSLTALMEACYDAPTADFPNPYCTGFVRFAGNESIASRRFQLQNGFHTGFANAGRRSFEAMTFAALVSLPLGSETRLTIDGQLFHLIKDSQSITGYDRSDMAGEVARSKWRGQLNVQGDHGPVSLFGQLRYLSSARFGNANSVESLEFPGVGAYWLVNTGLAWRVGGKSTPGGDPRMEWRVTIDNLFDVEPPFPAAAIRTLYAYDTVGRALRTSVRIGF